MSSNITTFLSNDDIYTSVEELKESTKLVAGQYVMCLGYLDIADGCRTLFKIVDENEPVGILDYRVELPKSGLFAELVIENKTINLLQLGGIPVNHQYKNGYVKEQSHDEENKTTIITLNSDVSKHLAFEYKLPDWVDTISVRISKSGTSSNYAPYVLDKEGLVDSGESAGITNTVSAKTLANGYIRVDTDLYSHSVDTLTITWSHTVTKNTYEDKKCIKILQYDLHDNHDAISRYVDLIHRNNGVASYKLYIPSGIWATSPVEIYTPVNIEGSRPSWEQLNNYGGTVITAIDDQEHVLALRPYFGEDELGTDDGGDLVYLRQHRDNLYPHNYYLKNLVLSSGMFVRTDSGVFKADGYQNKHITHSALRLHHTIFGTFEDISFHHVYGRCMTIKNSWELRFFGNLSILECCNLDGSLIKFSKVSTTQQVKVNGEDMDPYNIDPPNISNVEIYNVNVESVFGNIFEAEDACGLIDTIIQNIHIEPNRTCSLFTCLGNTYDEGKNEQYTYTSMSVFDIKAHTKLIVNNMAINNISMKKHPTVGNIHYMYDTIFHISGKPKYDDNYKIGITVGNIMIQGMQQDCNIVKTTDARVRTDGHFTLNSVGVYDGNNGNCVFDVQNFPNIICSGTIKNLTHNPVSLLSNSFNPCYKNVNNQHKGVKNIDGLLHYDADAINDLRLIVKTKRGVTSREVLTLPIKGKTLCVRAKIADGETYYPRFESAYDSQVYQEPADDKGMVGIGEYKLYEIDISDLTNNDVIKNNPLVSILTSTKTADDVEAYLDTYYFKD